MLGMKTTKTKEEIEREKVEIDLGDGKVEVFPRPKLVPHRDVDALDYDHWDRWAKIPDDPVSLQELREKKADIDRKRDEVFENANPEFCQGVKEDIKNRKEKEKSDGEQSDALRKRGNKLFRKREYEAALTCYMEALAITQTSCPILTNIAQCHLRLSAAAAKDASKGARHWTREEHDQAALDFCERALLVEPENIKALWRRAKLRMASNRIGIESAEAFTEGIEKDEVEKENNEEGSGKRVQVWRLALGDLQRALKAARASLERATAAADLRAVNKHAKLVEEIEREEREAAHALADVIDEEAVRRLEAKEGRAEGRSSKSEGTNSSFGAALASTTSGPVATTIPTSDNAVRAVKAEAMELLAAAAGGDDQRPLEFTAIDKLVDLAKEITAIAKDPGEARDGTKSRRTESYVLSLAIVPDFIRNNKRAQIYLRTSSGLDILLVRARDIAQKLCDTKKGDESVIMVEELLATLAILSAAVENRKNGSQAIFRGTFAASGLLLRQALDKHFGNKQGDNCVSSLFERDRTGRQQLAQVKCAPGNSLLTAPTSAFGTQQIPEKHALDICKACIDFVNACADHGDAVSFIVNSDGHSDRAGKGESSILSSAVDSLSIVRNGAEASLAASLLVKLSHADTSTPQQTSGATIADAGEPRAALNILKIRGSATGLLLVEAVAYALSNIVRTLLSGRDGSKRTGKVFWENAAHDGAALLSNLSRTSRGRSSVQFVMICQERDSASAKQGASLALSLLKIAGGPFPPETRAACLACLSNASFASPGSLDKKTQVVRKLIATMGASQLALSLLDVSNGDGCANERESWELKQRAAAVLARFAGESASHETLRKADTISKLCQILKVGVSHMERTAENGKACNTVANVVRTLAIILSFPSEAETSVIASSGSDGQLAAQYALISIRAVVRSGGIECLLKLLQMSVSEGLKVGARAHFE